MHYAGIGSRATPIATLVIMTRLAENLEQSGFILRSGAAKGADTAFEQGVTEEDHKEIYLPWKGYNRSQSSRYHINQTALELAERFHPNWNACSDTVRKFHARNCYQVLGQTLDEPARFILCWTSDGKASGGTGQALRIADYYSIPIFNMQTNIWETHFDAVMETILTE